MQYAYEFCECVCSPRRVLHLRTLCAGSGVYAYAKQAARIKTNTLAWLKCLRMRTLKSSSHHKPHTHTSCRRRRNEKGYRTRNVVWKENRLHTTMCPPSSHITEVRDYSTHTPKHISQPLLTMTTHTHTKGATMQILVALVVFSCLCILTRVIISIAHNI